MPQNILLSVHHALYVGLNGIVIDNGYTLAELLGCFYFGVRIFFSPLGVLRALNEFMKNLLLNIVRIFQKQIYLVNSFFHPPGEKGVEEGHCVGEKIQGFG